MLLNNLALRRMIAMIIYEAFLANHFIMVLTIMSDLNFGMIFAKD
jgi:hypothetical protein